MTWSVSRTQRGWIAVVVLVAVIAALVSWRHLRDGRSHSKVGTTIPATDVLGARTNKSFVLLPDGRYDISATGALGDVEGDAGVRSVQAPQDGSFVGLQIERGVQPAVTRWGFGAAAGTGKAVAPRFTLVADGRRYPLASFDAYGRGADEEDSVPYGAPFLSQRVYVAVAGSPRRLQLDVEYAGRSQRVDLRSGTRQAGSFASLYVNQDVKRDCGTARWTTGFRSAPAAGTPCVVDLVQRTPYYPRYGWAPAGRTWLVVGVTTPEPPGLEFRTKDHFARYEIFGLPKVAMTLDGAKARATGLFSNVFGSSRRDVSLFSASVSATSPGHALRVTATYDTGLRGDSVRTGVSYDPTVRVSWLIPV